MHHICSAPIHVEGSTSSASARMPWATVGWFLDEISNR